MLKVENVEVIGWEHAIRGMRNPKNSWAKSDSGPECPYEKEKCLEDEKRKIHAQSYNCFVHGF